MKRSFRIALVAAAVVAALIPTGPSSAGNGHNLLCHPGFEGEDNDCWTRFGPTYSTDTSHTGNYSARYCQGDTDGCLESFKQKVHVPRFISSAQASVWVLGATSDDTEDCSSRAGLWLVDPLDRSDKFFVGPCEEMSDTWETGEFTQYVDTSEIILAWLEAREGQDIKVWAAARHNDGGDPVQGDIFIDDVYLSITTPTPYDRDITLDLSAHLRAKGTVSSLAKGYPEECIAGATVHIQRKVGGAWKRIDSDTTSNNGDYNELVSDKLGKFRAVAPKFEVSEGEVCGAAYSNVETHSH